MRVLVIGATGFVGSYLVSILSAKPNLEVSAIIHSTQPKKLEKKATYIQGDMGKITYEFLENGRFEIIFHVARISGRRFGDIGRFIAGVRGYWANKKLLKIINALPDKPKIVYLSGSLMYGHNPGSRVTEDYPLKPTGFAKYYYRAELPFLKAIASGNNNVMMLRAPWILGNDSWFKQLYLNRIRRENILPIYGDPGRGMSIIAVEDCAAILWHYAMNAKYNAIYNVYTFQKIIYRDFGKLVSDATNEELTINVYTGAQMDDLLDKTMQEAVCAEIVLDTHKKNILASYKALYPDLAAYLKMIITQAMSSDTSNIYYNEVGEYFNFMAEKFVGKREENEIFTGIRASFRQHTKHNAPKNILDIGCGDGNDVFYFAQKYPEAEVYGIDVSDKMLHLASVNLAALKLKNVHFLQTGIETIKDHINQDQKFDIIYVYFGALNTVSSLHDTAEIINDLLNPGGIAVLTTINKYYLSEFLIHTLKGNIKKATARWKKDWPGYSSQKSLPSRTYAPSTIKKSFSAMSLKEMQGYSIFYPAWFQSDWLKRFPRLCKLLYKMDVIANKTPLWKYGEYTLFVYEKK